MKNILTERKSIRKYDANTKISREELLSIIADTQRAPSSQNMQPIRFFIVESDAAKEKLRPVLTGNQMQLDTSSAMICLFADTKKFDKAKDIYKKAVDSGYMPQAVMDRQLASFAELDPNGQTERNKFNAILDGGIIAQQLMLVAKSYGYDTCPIGGFKKDLINEALNIDNQFMPLLVVSIGKADEAGFTSVRLDTKDVTYFL